MFAKNLSAGRKSFIVLNTVLILLITLACLIPIINLLARSFSSSQAIIENRVSLWPVDFNVAAYRHVLNTGEFWTASVVTLKRVLLGVPINMLLTILAAYPLSKSNQVFKARKYYSFYFIFLLVFNGGLIPTYIIVSQLGLIDSIWSLILPGAVPIFNVILVMNFFRGLPEELEESAMLDGAGQWTILWRIFLPLSKPSIATVSLFALIGHWNAWFDGLIYSNFTSNYPLQSYLQTLVIDIQGTLLSGDLDSIINTMNVNDINLKAAQIFISIIPLFAVYPFMQKYFTEGLTLGSVKG